jgi:hypothetical protein
VKIQSTSIKLYWLLLGLLAVWRITHLLQAEDGPSQVLVRLRVKVGKGVLGRLLDCFYCLSIWVSAPFAALIGADPIERLFLWPALSGAASLLERVTQRPPTVTTPNYIEDPEP